MEEGEQRDGKRDLLFNHGRCCRKHGEPASESYPQGLAALIQMSRTMMVRLCSFKPHKICSWQHPRGAAT